MFVHVLGETERIELGIIAVAKIGMFAESWNLSAATVVPLHAKRTMTLS